MKKRASYGDGKVHIQRLTGLGRFVAEGKPDMYGDVRSNTSKTAHPVDHFVAER